MKINSNPWRCAKDVEAHLLLGHPLWLQHQIRPVPVLPLLAQGLEVAAILLGEPLVGSAVVVDDPPKVLLDPLLRLPPGNSDADVPGLLALAVLVLLQQPLCLGGRLGMHDALVPFSGVVLQPESTSPSTRATLIISMLS